MHRPPLSASLLEHYYACQHLEDGRSGAALALDRSRSLNVVWKSGTHEAKGIGGRLQRGATTSCPEAPDAARGRLPSVTLTRRDCPRVRNPDTVGWHMARSRSGSPGSHRISLSPEQVDALAKARSRSELIKHAAQDAGCTAAKQPRTRRWCSAPLCSAPHSWLCAC